MANPEWCVRSVTPLEDYKLYLTFEDGKQGIYDVKPLLKYPFYSKLSDPEMFRQAKVVNFTVAWTDEIDIAPENLYDNCV